MNGELQSRFEDDWQKTFSGEFQKLLPSLRLAKKKNNSIALVVASIFFGVALYALAPKWALVLPGLALVWGIYGIRKYKLPADYRGQVDHMEQSINNSLLSGSLFKWQLDSAGTSEIRQAFGDLFARQEFKNIAISDCCQSDQFGAVTYSANIVATAMVPRTVTKSRLVDGKSQTYTETEMVEEVVFRGRGGLITLEKHDDLIAAGMAANIASRLRLATSGLEPVDLESIDFEKKFNLYANHQREVRELFTPDLLNEISDWLDEAKGMVALHVTGNKIFLVSNQLANFRIVPSDNLDSYKTQIKNLYQFLDHFDHLLSRLIYHERERLNNYQGGS